ncbi:MAG: toprim domain-containing protein [Bryobacteraceae bacterium]
MWSTGSDNVIVVEGYFDCLRGHQAGFRCVVGLMGCALSVQQETLLLERFKNVLLMLDGDQAGRDASRAIVARLPSRCSVGLVRVPDGAQPDQLLPEAIRRLLERPE